MPSPFPGMDPYLERPDRWSGVHAGVIAVIREVLAGQVAPRFFVDSEDNVYILGADDPARAFVRPDVYVAEVLDAGAPAPDPARGRIAVPLVLDLPAPLELRVPYLTVVDTAEREVVATIEVLSPVNKTHGSSGRRDFLRKREDIVHSRAHWLEIDLLRAGTRPPGIPSRGEYYAALHRAGVLDRMEAWFASLREPLPTIAVPLRPPFADVPLDLQEVVDLVYARYRYDTGIDYAADPPPPLRAEDATWVRDRVAAWQMSRDG